MEEVLLILALAVAVAGMMLMGDQNRQLAKALRQAHAREDEVRRDMQDLVRIVRESSDDRVRKASRYLWGAYSMGRE